MFELSIVATTCGQPNTFAAWWQKLVEGSAFDKLKSKVQVIVVDDHGDPSLNATEWWGPSNAMILRVDDDIAWNQPGARNLGVRHAEAPVILSVDGDMAIEPEMLPLFLAAAKGIEVNQCFIPAIHYQQRDEINVVHAHNYMIQKESLEALGGYDEDYCGAYGWEDVQMLHLMEKLLDVRRDTNLWVRHLDSVDDHAVQRYDRDPMPNHALHLRKMNEIRSLGPVAFSAQRRGATNIRFAWHRAF